MSFPSGRRCFGHPHSLYAQAVRVVLVDPMRSLPPSLLRRRSSREICTVPICALYPSSQWSVLLFLFGSSFLAEALPPSFGFHGGYLPLPLSVDARLLQVSSLVDALPPLSCWLLSCRLLLLPRLLWTLVWRMLCRHCCWMLISAYLGWTFCATMVLPSM